MASKVHGFILPYFDFKFMIIKQFGLQIPVENNYSTVVRKVLWALKVLKLVIAQHSRCEDFKKTENEFDKPASYYLLLCPK